MISKDVEMVSSAPVVVRPEPKEIPPGKPGKGHEYKRAKRIQAKKMRKMNKQRNTRHK